MNLKNKNILITGAAVRVGRATAYELSGGGAHLFCHYNKSKDAAQSLFDDIKKAGATIHILHAELRNINECEKLIEQVVSVAGNIDVLINNAAVFYKTPFGTVDEEIWDKQFEINLKAPFFLAQKAGLLMKEQGSGKIINIGDTSGEIPWPGYIPYSLTKSGIIAMTKGLARVLAPQVQVNCINPGPVMIPEDYTSDEEKKAIEKTLLKKTGQPTDIARSVRFLLEGSDYITGAILNVDGGRSIG